MYSIYRSTLLISADSGRISNSTTHSMQSSDCGSGDSDSIIRTSLANVQVSVLLLAAV
jgi:hypothetical protein